MHIKVHKLQRKPRKRLKRHLLAESESASHSVRHILFFASNFEIIRSNLDYKLLVLHVYSIFVWIMIKMQWLPLILNGKSTDKALFCLYEGISFISVTKLICS